MTQEFHISVTPVGQDEYLVRTERVAPGVPLAEEKIYWPVDDWLKAARHLMDDPLLGLLRVNNGDNSKQSLKNSTGNILQEISANAKTEELDIEIEKISGLETEEKVNNSSRSPNLNLIALGEELYSALFSKSMRDSWMIAQGIAQHRGDGLRLRLGLKGNRLPLLPWEVLHADDRPLATGADVLFSRYQPGTTLIAPPLMRSMQKDTIDDAAQEYNLRILMILAAPNDRDSLALEKEANHLQEELQNRSTNRLTKIQLNILTQPDREELTRALEQGNYQVFHYAGHSNLGAAGGELYLVSRRTGLSETLSGHDLAGLLANNGIKLAVFNSCRGAHTVNSPPNDDGRERNLAQALVKRDIPAVLAMAERIPDDVALTLTRLFYRNLNQGYPVDLSLSRARQGLISAYGSHQLYWALPILYLHPEFDGYLTDKHDDKVTPTMPPIELPIESDNWLPGIPHRSNLGKNQPGFLHDDNLLDEIDDYDVDHLVDDLEYEDDFLDDEESASALVSEILRQVANDSVISQSNFTDKKETPAEIKQNNQKNLDTAIPTTPDNQTDKNNSNITDNPTQDTGEKPENIGENITSKIDTKINKKIPILWPILAVIGVTSAGLLGTWIFGDRFSTPKEVLPSTYPQVSQPLNSKPNLKTADNKTLNTIAIDAFNRGDMLAGQKVIEELLNPKRNAIKYAKDSLATLPTQKDTAAITFLRGRLAWQSVQAGDRNFSIDDARRYWETAVKNNPKVALYHNALGFAYYAEGNLNLANKSWFQALYLHDEQSSVNNQNSVSNYDDLTSYAGLALGLMKTAKNQPPDKQASLISEAIKLRDKVLRDDPKNFQPDELRNNWMWMETTIKDWRSLLKLQVKK